MFSGLQVVRFGAALAIVLLHASVFTPGLTGIDPAWLKTIQNVLGQGVLVFFVLSGFLMARIMDGSRGPLAFLAHRILRIYPALLAAEAITLAGKYLVLGSVPPFEWYVFTLYPFGPSTIGPSPLNVEWTLVYEMFFYVVIALLCAVPNDSVRKLIVGAWAFSIIIANVDFPRGGHTAISPTIWQIPLSYLDLCFITGMVAWWLRDLAERAPAAALLLPGLAGLTGYGWGLPWLSATMLTAIGAALVILAASRNSVTARFSPRSWLVRGGDASYGLYLIHVPVITVFVHLTGVTGWLGFMSALALAVPIGILFGTIEWRNYLKMRRISNELMGAKRITRAVITRIGDQPSDDRDEAGSLASRHLGTVDFSSSQYRQAERG